MSRDSRLEYRRHEKNIGHIATYNEGLEWASSEYLLLLSADDLVTPGALHRAAAVLDAHPNVVLTYGGVINLPPNKEVAKGRPILASPDYTVLSGNELLEKICAEGDNIVPTPSVVVRRLVQAKVGGYNPELPHTGDLEMWMRFAIHGSVAELKADQAYYRLHASNMHHSYTRKAVDGIVEIRHVLDYFIEKCPNQGLDSDRLKAIARKGLARRAFWIANGSYDMGLVEDCQELINFALATDPEIRHWNPWKHYTWKRRLGPKVWSAVRPWIRRLRHQLSRT
jgi:glycosyltransferase involved in cell wall biosynthesis